MSAETQDRDKRTIDRWEHERYIALEADLEAAADRLAKTHPIGQVKAIGLREVAAATAEVCDELDRLRTERDALVAAWPCDSPSGPIMDHDGRFWMVRDEGYSRKRFGPFPTREAAILAAIGAVPAPDPS